MTIVIVVAVAVVVGLIMFFAGTNKAKSDFEKTVGSAEKKSREIIDDAIRTAENKKREALLETKEEALKAKNDLDKEIKDRRKEVSDLEHRMLKREEASEKKAVALDQKEQELRKQQDRMQQKEAEIDELHNQKVTELERVSGLTRDQAKSELLKSLEEDTKHDYAKMIREYDNQAKEEAEKSARNYIVDAIQRCAADQVTESTVSVVQLPNDDMKGRIIGREGRNIRTLETLTGVDLIIDDTPEAITLSCFDPVRREVARLTLEKLIIDGRIHPARIEEMVEKSRREVDQIIKQEGERAVLETGVHGLHPELVKLLGRMRYRTSYGQNVLQHSIEVSHIAGILAGELGINATQAKRAGLLHDIGKAVDREMEGSHVDIGVDLCKRYHEHADIVHAVQAHHGDIEAKTLVACLVQAADAISAARPGARRENLEAYIKRLEKLEEIANTTPGVSSSYAIQAGREIRIIVNPEQVNDSQMILLSREIAKKIEDELEYPGQIKINMIRETRAVEYAK